MGWGGAEGEGGGSRVSRLNDSRVTKPSPTVCVVTMYMYALVFLAHTTFHHFFCFLMISAVTNSCIQSTTCFKPDTVNKTVTREREGGREGGRERERERERERWPRSQTQATF